ncbi:MAG: gas vesicle protein GvpG [Pseudomonadota bacterium]
MLFKLLSAPFSLPINGTLWLAGEIKEAADREQNDPARLRLELDALEKALEAGEIDEAHFEALEDDLITRLQMAQAAQP